MATVDVSKERYDPGYANYELDGPTTARLKSNMTAPPQRWEDDPQTINWDLISGRYKLPADYIRTYCQYLNWQVAVRFQNIPADVIQENIEKMDWVDILTHQKLTIEFINEHLEVMTPNNMAIIFQYQTLPTEWIGDRLDDALNYNEQTFRRLLDIAVIYQELNEEIISRYYQYINKGTLVRHQKLSIRFIREHLDDFNMSILVANQTLDEPFIREFYDRMDSVQLMMKQDVPNDLINNDENISLADRCRIQDPLGLLVQINSAPEDIKQRCTQIIVCRHLRVNDKYRPLQTQSTAIQQIVDEYLQSHEWQDLGIPIDSFSQDFIVRNWDNIPNKVNFLLDADLDENFIKEIEQAGHQLTPLERFVYVNSNQFSSSFIEQHQDCMSWYKEYKEAPPINDTIRQYIVRSTKWKHIVRHEQLPEWFMTEFAGQLDWWKVPHYQKNLSMEFINLHLERIDFEQVCLYQNLTPEFIAQHGSFLPWEVISRRQALTVDVAKQFLPYINQEELARNDKIDPTTKSTILSGLSNWSCAVQAAEQINSMNQDVVMGGEP